MYPWLWHGYNKAWNASLHVVCAGTVLCCQVMMPVPRMFAFLAWCMYPQLWHGYNRGSTCCLCRHLIAHPEIVAGKRVIEIGAGCGLCGMLAVKLQAHEVSKHCRNYTCTEKSAGHSRCKTCLLGVPQGSCLLSKGVKPTSADLLSHLLRLGKILCGFPVLCTEL